MNIDLDERRLRMSVGEFADFTLGPRDAGEGPAGVWRAQLGTHWHNELRLSATAGTEFEVPIEGEMRIGQWTVRLNGRLDQLVRRDPAPLIREIKTVTRPLPEGEEVLRREYPGYFVQLAAYVALLRTASGDPPAQRQPPPNAPRSHSPNSFLPPAVAPGTPASSHGAGTGAQGELVFVEVGTGFTQTVELVEADRVLLNEQLARVGEFLELRRRARERLKGLVYRPAFHELRVGQEAVAEELVAKASEGKPAVLLEAPTGFGKTGVLLEFALGQLRAGRFDRAVYLTGKATGQIQVARTLAAMAPPDIPGGPASWLVRPKVEHCVNTAFHCVREDCRFLDGIEDRWNASGLARFYLLDGQPRDLPSLRAAGMDARICPYEITRAALPFNDLWIGDYNYVFAPGSRGLFYHQPGFDPARSLLIVDEAHNLPSRVADAYSHHFIAAEAEEAGILLRSSHPLSGLVSAWDAWCDLLGHLRPQPALDPAVEARARELIPRLAEAIREAGVDYSRLTPRATEIIWELPSLAAELEEYPLPRLAWCRRPGELSLTCLDAAAAIGATLSPYGTVVLASATPGPAKDFAAACGLDALASVGQAQVDPGLLPPTGRFGELTKRETKKLVRNLSTGADLLRAAEAAESPLAVVHARTPWRDDAYDIAVDMRVDTTFQHRSVHARTTALTIARLSEAARGPAAAFFPSFTYAEMIREEIAAQAPGCRVSLQPRALDLAAQTVWIESELAENAILLLVLGSGFAESVDLLGGRVSHGIVVGPALPEVNAVQRARLAAWAPLGRDLAVRRTYQIPGMQKVNQALGRLVRAPGQRARVVLHCRRFAEQAYQSLLATDYRGGKTVESDDEWEDWISRRF